MEYNLLEKNALTRQFSSMCLLNNSIIRIYYKICAINRIKTNLRSSELHL